MSFFFGSKGTKVKPQYTGIQVQTSGSAIPLTLAWGLNRMAPNIFWYRDFKNHEQRQKAGKGGATITSYTYSASLLLGLCQGPITGIARVFKDQDTTTTYQALGFTLFTGAIGQSPWGYLTTAYPAEALSYSGVAYLAAANYDLGSSASTPQHSFEVQSLRYNTGILGNGDADPALCVQDILTDGEYGAGFGSGVLDTVQLLSTANATTTGDGTYQTYCRAQGLGLNPVLSSQESYSSVIDRWALLTDTAIVWTGYSLKFIPYCTEEITAHGYHYVPNLTAIYSISDSDYLSAPGEPPVTVTRSDPSDANNSLKLTLKNRDNEYNDAPVEWKDQGLIDLYGVRQGNNVEANEICTLDQGMLIVSLIGQRTAYSRNVYEFSVSSAFCLLEPMDIVVCKDPDLGDVSIWIEDMEEQDDYSWRITGKEIPMGIANAGTAQPITNDPINLGVDPGSVEANNLYMSEDLDHMGYWVRVNSGVTADATTGPFGNATADKITETTANGQHKIYQALYGYESGMVFTTVVYVKAADRTFATVLVYDQTSNDYAGCNINLSTGATTDAGNGGFAYSIYSVTDMGSGWYKIRITVEATTSDNALHIFSSSALGTTSYVGTSGWGIYATCAQTWQGDDDQPYVRTWAVRSTPVIFNPPSVLTPAGIEVWSAISGGNPFWGGCNVWASVDGGDTYTMVGVFQGRSRQGFLTAALPDHADPDSTNTLSVNLTQSLGDLSDATHESADLGSTLSIIETELLSYGEVTLTDPYEYDLDYLRRGSLNSVRGAHDIGVPFVRLDDYIFKFPYLSVQAGQTIQVKFQSFNIYGAGTRSLTDCIAYNAVPYPTSTAGNASGWTATGTQFENEGQSIPAIVITGASQNPNAEGIVFGYRVTGTTDYALTAQQPGYTTRVEITSVTSNTDYDVAVAYVVNGVPGPLTYISTVTVGQLNTSGPTDGSILKSDAVPGTDKTFTCPAGSYTHIEIEYWGPGGYGNFLVVSGEKGGSVNFYGGGAGGYSFKTSIPVTPGSTVITYDIEASGSTTAMTCTAPSTTMVVNPGGNATTTAVGTGGSASGGSTNTTGHNGGLTNTWDGGGSAPAFVDQTSNGMGGTTPGGGGAGATYNSGTGSFDPSPGTNGSIKITART